MNDEERDNLLIRIDERTKILKEKADAFEKIVDVVKSHASDIKVIKWVGSTAVTLGGLVVGILEYLKK